MLERRRDMFLLVLCCRADVLDRVFTSQGVLQA